MAVELAFTPTPPSRTPDSPRPLATFEVEDAEATVGEMRAKGITFEEYDMPGLKTEGGIAEVAGSKGGWFKDPDGNILAVFEPPPA